MNKIRNLIIDTSDMPSEQIVRKLTVEGDVGSSFLLLVLQPGATYYDFLTETFETGHNDTNNNLVVHMNSLRYQKNIIFPSGSGDYIIKLIALPGTEVDGDSNKHTIIQSLTKIATNATITFQAATANTNNYDAFPTTTSQAEPEQSAKKSIAWTISNRSDNASYAYGLKEINQGEYEIDGKAWYFQATDTVDGAVTSSFTVKVDDTTDIAAGMIITGGTGLSGTPTVTNVDTTTKTLTLSTAQTFSNGITLTFRAYGREAIYNAIGVALEFPFAGHYEPIELRKTVRADGSSTEATDGSSTNIALNGTYGIAGGNTVRFLGLGVDNETATTVSTVSTSHETQGIITVSRAQVLEDATELLFVGTHQTIDIFQEVKISNHGTTNRTINLDLDKFLAVGVSGL